MGLPFVFRLKSDMQDGEESRLTSGCKSRKSSLLMSFNEAISPVNWDVFIGKYFDLAR